MDLNVILAELASFVLVSVFFLGMVVLLLVGGILIFLQYLRFRNREEVSLNFVLLEIAVPRDNETKIDAAEQILPHFTQLNREVSGRDSMLSSIFLLK